MYVDTAFGFKGRHHVKYSDDGGLVLKLWSFYDGSFLGAGNVSIEFSFNGQSDIKKILFSLESARLKGTHGFISLKGKFTKFLFKEDNSTIYLSMESSNEGELEGTEINELTLILNEILSELDPEFVDSPLDDVKESAGDLSTEI